MFKFSLGYIGFKASLGNIITPYLKTTSLPSGLTYGCIDQGEVEGDLIPGVQETQSCWAGTWKRAESRSVTQETEHEINEHMGAGVVTFQEGSEGGGKSLREGNGV